MANESMDFEDNETTGESEKKSKGPGTFQPKFLDQLYQISSKGIKNTNIEII